MPSDIIRSVVTGGGGGGGQKKLYILDVQHTLLVSS